MTRLLTNERVVRKYPVLKLHLIYHPDIPARLTIHYRPLTPDRPEPHTYKSNIDVLY